MNGKEYMSRLFRDHGHTHVFYMETLFTATFLDLEEMYGVKPVLAHSELAAGYMADGYARSTQKPGLCFAQSIGAANLAAGIHDAWLANSPVVAVTGKKMPHLQYRNAYQESDHSKLFQGVTKFHGIAFEAGEFARVLKQGLREATTGRPQPVHIDAFDFEGIATEDAEMNGPYDPELQYSKSPAYRPSADESSVKKAAEAINKASKPILVIGRGAAVSDKEKTLAALARKADIPIVCTPDGKTFVDEDDSLWLGVAGTYGMFSANRAIKEADLVIYAGSMVSDQTTLGFSAPSSKTLIIQIDIDGAKIGQNYPNTIGLNGDVLMVAGQLAKEVKEKRRDQWREATAAYKREFFKELTDLADKASNGVNIAKMCGEISKVLPDDAIVVADTGWSAMWSSTALRMKSTQNYYRAAGTLGWSFPASLGVKCAHKERPVINFTGDGGMMYYFTEWETAVREGLNIISIVNHNGLLAQCVRFREEATQKMMDQEREKISFPNINFSEAAKAFGANGVRIEKIADLAPAIKVAIESEKPTLIEVMTDWEISPLAPIK